MFFIEDLRCVGRFLATFISFVVGIGVSALCVHFLKDDMHSLLFVVVIPLVYFGLKFYSKCPNCKNSFCTKKNRSRYAARRAGKGDQKSRQ